MKKILISAGVFIGLLAAYYGLQRQQNEEREVERAKTELIDWDLSQAASIMIRRQKGDAQRLRFEKRAQDWWIVEPIKDRANQTTINGIILQLKSKNYENEFAADDFAKFELDPPKYLVEFSGSGTTTSIRIGKKAPVGENLYVRINQDPKVLAVPGGFTYNLEKPLAEYRGKEMFWDAIGQVTAAEFVSAGAELHIELRNDQWYAGEVSLDSEKVDPLITRVKDMRIRDFPENNPESPLTPQANVRLWGQQGSVAVEFAGLVPEEKQYWARAIGRQDWVSISDYVYDNLWKRPDELKFNERGKQTGAERLPTVTDVAE